MCLTRRTWRTIGRRFLICVFTVFVFGGTNLATSAQWSQDYINGQVNQQIKALSDRVANLEKVGWFIFMGIGGVLITNIMGLRNQSTDRKQQVMDRQEYRDDTERFIERRLTPRKYGKIETDGDTR